MIELKTLGLGAIRRDGQEVARLSGHRQKFALLTYLALEGRTTRERLLRMFWPERKEERARHSLSQALYALKRELGEEPVAVEGDELAIVDAVCKVDSAKLERAAEDEDWSKVVEIYCGPFLEQFALAGAPEFEKWQSRTRTRLARLARRGFKAVIGERAGRGDLPEAVATAWRWATLEPLEDEAQHTLIQLLAESGDRSGALAQYDTYRDRLARELEVEPLDGTKALIESIKSGEPTTYRPLDEDFRQETDTTVAETAPTYGEAERAPSASRREESLIVRLRDRRVFHVGAVYLAVAWLTLQFADTLADRGVLPDWVFPLVLFILILGLALALILAWAAEAGTTRAAEIGVAWPGWMEKVRSLHLLGFLGILVVGLLAGFALMRLGLIGAGHLDDNRVLVYPFAVTPEGNEPEGLNAATLIGYTLESTGQLKYLDGWWELDDVQRAAVELVSPRTARERARALGAAYYIRGRVVMEPDSLRISAELHDVRRGRLVERVTSSGPRDAPWLYYGSEEIAQAFISSLVPSGSTIRLAAASDTPQASLAFLEGENHYRNARFSEALQRYQTALELDSSFTLAALKGTMGASWQHDEALANRFLGVLSQRSALLEPSRAQLAAALEDYWAGRADAAVDHLERALLIDPNYIEAWARLGETYTHFLPDRAPLDSLARHAFLEARRREPEFRPILYHLIEFALRAGALDSARVYLQEFREQSPDPDLLRQNELKLECVAESPQMIDWAAIAEEDPATVHAVGQSLARAGARTDCARAAWGALLQADLPEEIGTDYRFGALMALQSLLVAEGRFDELAALWESEEQFAHLAGNFFLIDTNAGAPFDARAEAEADSIRGWLATGEASSHTLWMLGVRESRLGRIERLRTIADTLAARSASGEGRLDSLLAEIMQARAALAAGDTAAAVDRLRDLTPTKTRSEDWYPWETLAAEKMLLARLLLGLERYAEALEVAETLDAPARQPIDLIYLPTSLVIRARAARALDETDLEERFVERLARLGRADLIATLENREGEDR
ncbi:MAG: hypothetical protein GWN32_01070 [Gemmatimonadetes bacterium]|nr:hypothetical protein [Gemmatimonadota bacterium]